MQISIAERGVTLRQRLQDRLDRVGQLQCSEHGQPVVAVSIHDRENGWFDSTWTTCCDSLERQAVGIVRGRC